MGYVFQVTFVKPLKRLRESRLRIRTAVADGGTGAWKLGSGSKDIVYGASEVYELNNGVQFSMDQSPAMNTRTAGVLSIGHR